jgi:aspartokinase
MSKIRLGAVKVFERRACLLSLCRSEADAPHDICSRLTANRINLGLLTHIADIGTRESITAASTKSIGDFSGFIHEKTAQSECGGVKTLTDTCRISIFPHDQRPDVAASLIGVLVGNGIKPYALGSSPSAITAIVASSDFKGTMEGLFDTFTFHAYGSYDDWQAAYRGQEELVQDVRLAYHEQIITIYDFTHRPDMDLWSITLPFKCLGDLGATLFELNQFQLRMPFLVSTSRPDEEDIYFALLFEGGHHDRVEQILAKNLPGHDSACLGPVTVFFLHGPHFGDRYGIAHALLRALQNAGIPLLALSCAVSSISVVVPGNDSNRTIKVLNSVFQTSVRQPQS